MAIIVACSGKKGSGKSLLGNPYLTRRGFKVFNFADMLKQYARQLGGLSPEHTDGKFKEVPIPTLGGKTPRDFMIALGKLMRDFSDDGLHWVKTLFEARLKQLPPDQLVYIGDCRFRNEANYVRDRGGVLIRLNRKESDIVKLGYKPSDDPSETDLDEYYFDAVLTENRNKTPQDLEGFADEIVNVCTKAKSKCKNDYSRFNTFFNHIWSDHT
jgi:hypothetical protein